MENRYYYLSHYEYNLLILFGLTRFVKPVPVDSLYYSFQFVIPYDCIDALARAVYFRKNKSGKDYKKLISFVDRLQDILESNPDIC